MFFLLSFLTLAAHAGGFQAKASRDPLPSREVERALVLPKGWVEMGVGLERKTADERWTTGGRSAPLDADYARNTETFRVRSGLTRRHELWASLPLHQVAIGARAAASVGDPRFGWRWSLLRTEAPNTSLALEVGYKAPAAREGEPGLGVPRAISFTSGTGDLSVGLGLRRQLGGLALTPRVSYVRRFAGLAGYLPVHNGAPALRTLKPGDLVVASLDGLLQAGPLVFAAMPQLTRRAASRVGVDPVPVPAERHLPLVENSGGIAVELQLRGTFQVTRGFDLGVYSWLALRGEDFGFDYIEDIHPTRGATVGGDVKWRF